MNPKSSRSHHGHAQIEIDYLLQTRFLLLQGIDHPITHSAASSVPENCKISDIAAHESGFTSFESDAFKTTSQLSPIKYEECAAACHVERLLESPLAALESSDYSPHYPPHAPQHLQLPVFDTLVFEPPLHTGKAKDTFDATIFNQVAVHLRRGLKIQRYER